MNTETPYFCWLPDISEQLIATLYLFHPHYDSPWSLPSSPLGRWGMETQMVVDLCKWCNPILQPGIVTPGSSVLIASPLPSCVLLGRGWHFRYLHFIYPLPFCLHFLFQVPSTSVCSLKNICTLSSFLWAQGWYLNKYPQTCRQRVRSFPWLFLLIKWWQGC